MNKPHIFCESLCTYGQAAQIILKHKGIEFLIDEVDAQEKADWLAEITPIKRLPLLNAENRFIFGTFALCEYIDEAYPHSIQPKKAIEKAINRSWIEFSVTFRNSLRQLIREKDSGQLSDLKEKLVGHLTKLNTAVTRRPFFNGDKFSVLDAIYAPLLHRIMLLKMRFGYDLMQNHTQISNWLEELFVMEEVASTLNDDFNQAYCDQIARLEGILFQNAGLSAR